MSGVWRDSETSKENHTFQPIYVGSGKSRNRELETISGEYLNKHQTQDMSAYGRGQVYDTEDTLNIYYLAEDKFAFKNRVVGGNFHIGSISGVATISTDGRAVFADGNGCTLNFDFDFSGNVTTSSEGCEDYGGARVHFGEKYKLSPPDLRKK